MKSRVATAGLVAFLAVDVGLVALALRAGRPSEDVPVTSTTRTAELITSTPATSTPRATSTTRPTGGSGGTGATSGGGKAVPVSRLVSALDAATAWRATTGTCDRGGATLELTTDGGQSWTKVRSPTRAVTRVQPLDSTRAFTIGAGADCTLKQYASRDAGQTWQAPTAVVGGWARRLDEPTQVLTPKESAATPCGDGAVLDLSRTSASQAQALCADGSVVLTGDGGSTWTDSGDAPGAVALSNLIADNSLKTYAVRVVSACKGVQLVEVAKGRTADVVACVAVPNVPRGEVGLSVTESAGWIVAGNQTFRARGDLTSWKHA
ncbi:hypothetical protein GCM10009721_41540 [Terrabacter tumescens]|uniref:Photosynthesis system II assembly factor Ycf48/Hcf136-like domain-containing protein n=1 Tax=Terrabacter tumescens TaxID=60443 RepID=A0ABQ2IIT2_9MICO|nr:hypothetical protein [Terrabacter tumescens]GGN09346.1 hypothetical protein GCM10009721_41540 [Terrabacter tumescens]